MLKFYSNPQGAGYLGWIEEDGEVTAFIRLDWSIQRSW